VSPIRQDQIWIDGLSAGRMPRANHWISEGSEDTAATDSAPAA